MQQEYTPAEPPAVDELIASEELLAPSPPWVEHVPFALALVDVMVRRAVVELCAPKPGWYAVGRTMLPEGHVRYTFGMFDLAHQICDLDLRAVSPLATELSVDSLPSSAPSAERSSYYLMMRWLLPRIRALLNDDQDDRRRAPRRRAGRPRITTTRWLYAQIDAGCDPDDPTLFAEWRARVEAARGRALADPERSYRDVLYRKK